MSIRCLSIGSFQKAASRSCKFAWHLWFCRYYLLISVHRRRDTWSEEAWKDLFPQEFQGETPTKNSVVKNGDMKYSFENTPLKMKAISESFPQAQVKNLRWELKKKKKSKVNHNIHIFFSFFLIFLKYHFKTVNLISNDFSSPFLQPCCWQSAMKSQ